MSITVDTKQLHKGAAQYTSR